MKIQHNKRTTAFVAFSAILVIALASTNTLPSAMANHAGEPTTFAGAINSGGFDTYIFTVLAAQPNLHVALMTNQAAAKPVMALQVVTPAGVVIPCPVIAGAALPVAECNIAGPAAGVWKINIIAGVLPNPPLQYVVSASTS